MMAAYVRGYMAGHNTTLEVASPALHHTSVDTRSNSWISGPQPPNSA